MFKQTFVVRGVEDEDCVVLVEWNVSVSWRTWFCKRVSELRVFVDGQLQLEEAGEERISRATLQVGGHCVSFSVINLPGRSDMFIQHDLGISVDGVAIPGAPNDPEVAFRDSCALLLSTLFAVAFSSWFRSGFSIDVLIFIAVVAALVFAMYYHRSMVAWVVLLGVTLFHLIRESLGHEGGSRSEYLLLGMVYVVWQTRGKLSAAPRQTTQFHDDVRALIFNLTPVSVRDSWLMAGIKDLLASFYDLQYWIDVANGRKNQTAFWHVLVSIIILSACLTANSVAGFAFGVAVATGVLAFVASIVIAATLSLPSIRHYHPGFFNLWTLMCRSMSFIGLIHGLANIFPAHELCPGSLVLSRCSSTALALSFLAMFASLTWCQSSSSAIAFALMFLAAPHVIIPLLAVLWTVFVIFVSSRGDAVHGKTDQLRIGLGFCLFFSFPLLELYNTFTLPSNNFFIMVLVCVQELLPPLFAFYCMRQGIAWPLMFYLAYVLLSFDVNLPYLVLYLVCAWASPWIRVVVFGSLIIFVAAQLPIGTGFLIAISVFLLISMTMDGIRQHSDFVASTDDDCSWNERKFWSEAALGRKQLWKAIIIFAVAIVLVNSLSQGYHPRLFLSTRNFKLDDCISKVMSAVPADLQLQIQGLADSYGSSVVQLMNRSGPVESFKLGLPLCLKSIVCAAFAMQKNLTLARNVIHFGAPKLHLSPSGTHLYVLDPLLSESLLVLHNDGALHFALRFPFSDVPYFPLQKFGSRAVIRVQKELKAFWQSTRFAWWKVFFDDPNLLFAAITFANLGFGVFTELLRLFQFVVPVTGLLFAVSRLRVTAKYLSDVSSLGLFSCLLLAAIVQVLVQVLLSWMSLSWIGQVFYASIVFLVTAILARLRYEFLSFSAFALLDPFGMNVHLGLQVAGLTFWGLLFLNELKVSEVEGSRKHWKAVVFVVAHILIWAALLSLKIEEVGNTASKPWQLGALFFLLAQRAIVLTIEARFMLWLVGSSTALSFIAKRSACMVLLFVFVSGILFFVAGIWVIAFAAAFLPPWKNTVISFLNGMVYLVYYFAPMHKEESLLFWMGVKVLFDFPFGQVVNLVA